MGKDNIIARNKKVCACKNCNNVPTTILKVKFIQKVGDFCNRCSKDLLHQGLAIKIGEVTK